MIEPLSKLTLMCAVRFTSPYPRPIAFSTAGEIADSEGEMGLLLLKPDHELNVDDLAWLFGPFNWGGTYEERVYFLPYALSIIEHQPETALDLISGIVKFAAEHCETMRTDGLWDRVVDAFRSCFMAWTEKFSVIHIDADAMRCKGSELAYADVVVNSYPLTRFLGALAQYPPTRAIAESLVSGLAKAPPAMPRSAWYLEYARMLALGEANTASEEVARLVGDPNARAAHADMVRRSALHEADMHTYWQDAIAALFPARGSKRDRGGRADKGGR